MGPDAIINKGLISNIYKQLIQVTIKKNNLKWAKLNKFFSETQMANSHVKTCSAELMIKEVQIKITMRHNLIPVKMTIIKMNTNNKCW